MRKALLVLVLGMTSAAGAAANGGGGGTPIQASVTGEIRQLDPHRVAIGHFACTIPAKLSITAGRFVIGDPVRMRCVRGRLASIKYWPEVGGQISKTGGGNAPTVAPSPTGASSCGLPCAKSISYSIGTASLGATSTGESSSLTDTIADISDAGITVGSLTCSYRSSLATLVAGIARVGDSVTLTCTGGVFTSMKSVGPLTR